MKKQCKACHSSLDTTDFYKKGDRLDSQCKQCVLALKKQKYRQRVARKLRRDSREDAEFLDLDHIDVVETWSSMQQVHFRKLIEDIVAEVDGKGRS